MKIHELKTVEPYFLDVWYEIKTFEIRKHDRNFQVNDLVLLFEYEPINNRYSGRWILCQIKYLLKKGEFEGLNPDYCAMRIEIIKKGMDK
jgi:hypothetical protein